MIVEPYLKEFEKGDSEKFRKLYEDAFPLCERKPVALIFGLNDKHDGELLGIYREAAFCGFVFCVTDEKYVLLDYIAVAEEERGRSTGGKILHQLKERYRGKSVFVEIEVEDDSKENAEQRRRRKNFYLRNGFKETGIVVNVYDVEMELLTAGEKISYKEYCSIFRKGGGGSGEVRIPVLISERAEGEKTE